MTQGLRITYELVGTGWSRCVVEYGEQRCEVSASYLSDALRNLVLFALAISSGFRSASFGMDEEPGEYRWLAELEEANLVKLRVLEFPELWGQKPNSMGKTLFEASFRPVVVAEAVVEAADRVLEAHGANGYRDKWAEHGFPERELTLLKASVAGWQQ